MSEFRRSLMMKVEQGGGGGLPSWAEQIDGIAFWKEGVAIAATGAFIKTSLLINSDLHICAKIIQLRSAKNVGERFVFGGYTSAAKNEFVATVYNDGIYYGYSSNHTSWWGPVQYDYGSIIEIDWNKNVLNYNGNIKTFTYKSFNTEISFSLGNSYSTAPSFSAFVGDIYLYQADELVHHFTPVKLKSTISGDVVDTNTLSANAGEIGLYDLVTEKYFGNAQEGGTIYEYNS